MIWMPGGVTVNNYTIQQATPVAGSWNWTYNETNEFVSGSINIVRSLVTGWPLLANGDPEEAALLISRRNSTDPVYTSAALLMTQRVVAAFAAVATSANSHSRNVRAARLSAVRAG